jgi:diguanylate cyclase (GGDEF)-like protein
MSLFGLPSLVGLLMQAIAALLIAVLCLALRNTMAGASIKYWSAGWLALFVALASLFAAFNAPVLQPIAQPVYVLGEYVFAYLVMAGCRRHVSGQPLRRKEAWMLVPGVLLAFGLPAAGGGNFNAFFAAHTLVYAYLFLLGFRVLWKATPHRRHAIGARVMKIALLLLTIDYAHYSPLFAASAYGLLPPVVPYLEYSPLYDLIFLVLLAFGMVMVATGEVQHALEVTNAQLAQTRDRLEAMAQLDHLTSALNRHAFYSMLGEPATDARPVLHGCAAMADVDNLKTINDRHGHAAGDAAIRAVATAMRSCIRADDLLFRWGGDEFLVLLIGMSESDARARLDAVNATLRGVTMPDLPEPVDLSVTLGYASFDSASSLEEVIALADTSMYDRKKTGSA